MANIYFNQIAERNAKESKVDNAIMFPKTKNNGNRTSESFYWGLHNDTYNRPVKK